MTGKKDFLTPFINAFLCCIIFTLWEGVCVAFESDLRVENNNLLGWQDDFSDLNRVRLKSYLEFSDNMPLAFTAMVDNLTQWQDDELTNRLELYRAFLSYQTDRSTVTLGRQRIPFGVGRIWNPTDVFNPINILSMEPEEREGTDSLRLEYAPSDLSTIDITVAVDQAALRVKGFYANFDWGLILVGDGKKDQDIIGWVVEGELLETGIELRSEGGWFYNTSTEEDHFEYIAGAEYGFVFPLTLLFEYRGSSLDEENSFALQFSSELTALLQVSLLALLAEDDGSQLYSPTLQYSLSDEMTLSAGIFFRTGKADELYGGGNSFFLNWFVQF